ncbi:TOBE domain-containing protein [Lutibacter flavus]|uniref:Molybdenum-pterin binding domain-containing protein n=1 Tax=Lutibacter flavus TaxID=691689 RepID=A0A238Z7Q4_9FLAO|nr:TOBE domain-containing protein [Lutibacter flavus]SNR79250.1 molybdenum-pterin binding domain-containing protein [Lutibacter flavus]
MNILKGKIEKLTVSGSLTLIGIEVNNIGMSAIVIDTSEAAPYLKLGNTITVVFKETEVIIGKGNTDNISLRNKFKGIIDILECKELLSKLTINTSVGKISSIITTNAVNQLNLKVGSEVTAMIKTNEIMLSE